MIPYIQLKCSYILYNNMGRGTVLINEGDQYVFLYEGRKAVFKAMVTGMPTPTVKWARVKCEDLDPEVYKTRYEERGKEHILEVRWHVEARPFIVHPSTQRSSRKLHSHLD